jgi:hypothetical protein
MKNNQTEHIPDGGKMMSSIEYILDNIFFPIDTKEWTKIFEKAKEMRMQELKHAYEAEQNNCRGIFKYESFEHYYRENYEK